MSNGSKTMMKVNQNINPNQLLELVEKAEKEGERIILEKEGKGQVAIINYADLEYLEALEDARDSELLRQAVAESKIDTPVDGVEGFFFQPANLL